MLPVIIVCIAFAAIGGSIALLHKNHNPVEEIAAEVIEKETGVDVDKLLPKD